MRGIRRRWIDLHALGATGAIDRDVGDHLVLDAATVFANACGERIRLRCDRTVERREPPRPHRVSRTLVTAAAFNKDFDLVVFPQAHHGYGANAGAYMMRRRWDYFITELMKATPPHEFPMPALLPTK